MSGARRAPLLAEDRSAALAGPLRVRPEAQAQEPEILDGPPDHRRLRARGRPGRPRVVRNADLHDGPALLPDPDEQLRREERAGGLDADPLEGLAPEQLARAVDVADPEAEEDAVRQLVGSGVRDPDERVRPLDA